ncbi:hypothetical protein J7T55_004007 [Diaporthe amygdali]|uniref:uncharacterized protein n=1 Tax=Phomopsis amygdali TaxID=1214568 RepID=UPI0022FDE7C2|nr:uncharacterized protein J7T55_004007 [Diaporthe amygdali]KAJ0115838.1 hypothetical protein J7T55_004007 [Diaporthe amygdali]
MAKPQRQAEGGRDGACRPPAKQQNDHSPSDAGDQSKMVSSAFPSNQTRPLFGSLEEAHSRITRLRPSGGSRSVSRETSYSGSGDDTVLKDMRSLSPTDARAIYTNVGYPVTRAFGRSLTDAVNRTVDEQALVPSPLLVQKQPTADPQKNNVFITPPVSKTAPIVWQSPDELWQSPQAYLTEARAFAEAHTSNQPPPYSPVSRADRTIDHCDPKTQNSYVNQSESGSHVLPVDGDQSIRKRPGEIEANATLGRIAEKGVGVVPQISLPEVPSFHHTNSFAASARPNLTEAVLGGLSALQASESPSPKRLSYCSDSKDDRARIGSDLGVGSGIGVDSDAGAASEESKVPQLCPPPARMHSARRRERGRQSLLSSARSSITGVTEGSEEDPFHYDSVFLRPSREREVSAYLRQVSGVERGSTAIICSPDGTPLRSPRPLLDRDSPSPEVSPLRLPQRTAVGNDARTQQDQEFFEPSAINPQWTVGSPAVVRVPVGEKGHAHQRQNLPESHAGGGGGLHKLVLEGLRDCEEQSRLPTGNTEEFGTGGFKQCGSSIANYSDCEAPLDAASTNPGLGSSLTGPRAGISQPAIGPFDTQPRIVHPPGTGNKPQDLRYRKHNVNQAPLPVFVPEQRHHRVNGLFQDTSRPVANTNPASNSQDQNRSQFFGQRTPSAIRDPFLQANSKRTSYRSFTLHPGLAPRHPFTELDSDDGSLHELQHITSQPDSRRPGTSGKRWDASTELDPNKQLTLQPDQMSQQRQMPRRRTPWLVPVTDLSTPSGMPQAHLNSRNRGDSFESGASISLIESTQFDLIPLAVAQQRQAIRLASGQEDQTLTGRARLESMRNVSCNTDASQAGSRLETPSSVVTPSTRKVSRFVPRGFAQASSPLSGRDENDTNALVAGGDSHPTISTTTGSDLTVTTIRQPDGTQYRIFDPAPRLYPWDRLHRRTAAQKSTDRSLQRITGRIFNNLDDMERGAVYRRVHDTEPWLSDNAKAKRRSLFLIVALLSIFPFVSPIALCGGFNSVLSWHTHGEVDRFSTKQRRCLMIEAIIAFLSVIAIIIFVVIKYALHH